jgi:hypothetical protein
MSRVYVTWYKVVFMYLYHLMGWVEKKKGMIHELLRWIHWWLSNISSHVITVVSLRSRSCHGLSRNLYWREQEIGTSEEAENNSRNNSWETLFLNVVLSPWPLPWKFWDWVSWKNPFPFSFFNTVFESS